MPRKEQKYLVHALLGRESTQCGSGGKNPAFVTKRTEHVTCPRCLKRLQPKKMTASELLLRDSKRAKTAQNVYDTIFRHSGDPARLSAEVGTQCAQLMGAVLRGEKYLATTADPGDFAFLRILRAHLFMADHPVWESVEFLDDNFKTIPADIKNKLIERRDLYASDMRRCPAAVVWNGVFKEKKESRS